MSKSRTDFCDLTKKKKKIIRSEMLTITNKIKVKKWIQFKGKHLALVIEYPSFS